MGKSKDLATLKDSGLSIDGTLTTTSTGTNLTSNSYNVVKIQTDKDDNGSNDDAILQFTTGSSNTVKGELRYDESESMFEIGHGDNQGHIRIDSSGRVTLPSQAYGEAEGNNSGLLTGFSTGTVINWFTANHLNGGMSFSNNGRFTVPVAGRYLINAQIYYYPGGSHTAYYALDLLKNGNLESFVIDDHAETVSGSIDRTVQLNMMVRASANDYFELRWGSNINGQFWRGAEHNKFRIFLIG